jgi:hypothetical protein
METAGSTASDFDPRKHRVVSQQRWFDDFRVGERFPLPSRTMTEAVFLAFQAASGDNHPIHYDVEYCRARGLQNMLAHGYLVAIQTVAGAGLFPHMVEDSEGVPGAIQPVPAPRIRRRHALSRTRGERAHPAAHDRRGRVSKHGSQSERRSGP